MRRASTFATASRSLTRVPGTAPRCSWWVFCLRASQCSAPLFRIHSLKSIMLLLLLLLLQDYFDNCPPAGDQDDMHGFARDCRKAVSNAATRRASWALGPARPAAQLRRARAAVSSLPEWRLRLLQQRTMHPAAADARRRVHLQVSAAPASQGHVCDTPMRPRSG